jgi:hypothetical protein
VNAAVVRHCDGRTELASGGSVIVAWVCVIPVVWPPTSFMRVPETLAADASEVRVPDTSCAALVWSEELLRALCVAK